MAKMIHLVRSGWIIAVNVTMSNSNAKTTNSTANGMKSITKMMNSIAKTNKIVVHFISVQINKDRWDAIYCVSPPVFT